MRQRQRKKKRPGRKKNPIEVFSFRTYFYLLPLNLRTIIAHTRWHSAHTLLTLTKFWTPLIIQCWILHQTLEILLTLPRWCWRACLFCQPLTRCRGTSACHHCHCHCLFCCKMVEPAMLCRMLQPGDTFQIRQRNRRPAIKCFEATILPTGCICKIVNGVIEGALKSWRQL